QLHQSPVAEHAGMQEILVDSGELVVEHLVQVLDDFRVAFHTASLREENGESLARTTRRRPKESFSNQNATRSEFPTRSSDSARNSCPRQGSARDRSS